jgi:hypothetical protein
MTAAETIRQKKRVLLKRQKPPQIQKEKKAPLNFSANLKDTWGRGILSDGQSRKSPAGLLWF